MMGGIFDQLSGKMVAMIGFGFAAVLLGVAILLTKSSSIPQDLTFMSMRVQQLYSGSTDYSGLDNTLAINAGIVPPNLVKGTSIKNAFNGDITIAPGSSSDTFTFTLTQIPKSECVTLANNKMNSWVSVSINGTTITDNDVSAVVSACTEKSTLIFEAQ